MVHALISSTGKVCEKEVENSTPCFCDIPLHSEVQGCTYWRRLLRLSSLKLMKCSNVSSSTYWGECVRSKPLEQGSSRLISLRAGEGTSCYRPLEIHSRPTLMHDGRHVPLESRFAPVIFFASGRNDVYGKYAQPIGWSGIKQAPHTANIVAE